MTLVNTVLLSEPYTIKGCSIQLKNYCMHVLYNKNIELDDSDKRDCRVLKAILDKIMSSKKIKVKKKKNEFQIHLHYLKKKLFFKYFQVYKTMSKTKINKK